MFSKVSIIIVHYASPISTINCLKSLTNAPKDCEVIVVDNDEKKTLQNKINKLKLRVEYISSPNNVGYGAGVNLGATKASGEFLFILNSDCYVLPNSIENLVTFLNLHPGIGLVAPLLLDENSIPYPFIASHKLTPLRGIFALTFINKIWPSNPVSRNYMISTSGLSKPIQIDVAPGAAFLVRKSVFRKVKGFDPKFFLYFEEFDLCCRIKAAGWDIYLIPSSRIIHYSAKSTIKYASAESIFRESRYYYFKKHYGLIWAIIIDRMASFSLKKFFKRNPKIFLNQTKS